MVGKPRIFYKVVNHTKCDEIIEGNEGNLIFFLSAKFRDSEVTQIIRNEFIHAIDTSMCC